MYWVDSLVKIINKKMLKNILYKKRSNGNYLWLNSKKEDNKIFDNDRINSKGKSRQ